MEDTFFRVAGTSFQQPAVLRCKEGDEVTLIPEPDNPYDQHAVQVRVHDCKVGYVPMDLTLSIKDILNSGKVESIKIVHAGRPATSPYVGLAVTITMKR